MKLIEKRLADLKARQDAGERLPCPRCGRMTMKPSLHTNALSRIADIMICDSCGVDEAKLAFMSAPHSLYDWALLQPVRPDGDFGATPGQEVIKNLWSEQSNTLFGLFCRLEDGETPEDVRLAGVEPLPGMTELWTQPFQAAYRAADGTVMVRVRREREQIEMAADLVPGK